MAMNRKSISERAKILQLLCEGNSLRGVARICDCSLNTVTKLLVDVGAACEAFQRQRFYGLPCKDVQVDEIWSFCYAKNKNLPDNKEGGNVWTFTAICRDTKLAPCWRVCPREAEYAVEFVHDLAARINGPFQLSTDGWQAYRDITTGLPIDFGRVVKLYAEPRGKRFGAYQGHMKEIEAGNPEPEKISTSHVERHNLTMRMHIRRFGRKTNAFSKKIQNHAHAVSLHFMYYNFVRIHQTLRVTPAMAAGLTDHVWSYEEVACLDNQADEYPDNKT